MKKFAYNPSTGEIRHSSGEIKLKPGEKLVDKKQFDKLTQVKGNTSKDGNKR